MFGSDAVTSNRMWSDKWIDFLVRVKRNNKRWGHGGCNAFDTTTCVSILLYHRTTYSQKEKGPLFTRPDGLIGKNPCRNATQLLKNASLVFKRSFNALHEWRRGGVEKCTFSILLLIWIVHPWRPRYFSRAKGNLEVEGDVRPDISRLRAVYGHSLIINPSLEYIRKYIPMG